MDESAPEAEEPPTIEAPAIPQYEEVNAIIGNLEGRDIHAHFIRRKFNNLNLLNYDPDGPSLKPEEGLGELKNPPFPIAMWEILKAGGEGVKDLSLVGGPKLPPRKVLSSRPYEIFTDEQNGRAYVKFLQYQEPDTQSNNFITRRHFQGEKHQGWTGNEIKSIVTVIWTKGIGPVVEPTFRRGVQGLGLKEEFAKAERILNDPEKKKEIDDYVASIRPKVDQVLEEARREKVVPITSTPAPQKVAA